MGVLGKQLYDKERVDKFGDYIQQNYDNGTNVDYEIIIDGFKVVKRTSNPDAFSNYEHFIFPDSKMLELVFFHGISNNNDRYLFAFKDEYLQGSNSLNGLDIDTLVNNKFQKTQKEWEYNKLKDENRALKDEVEELTKELDKQEREKQKILESQSPIKGLLGELGASFFTSFLRSNPKILTGIPALAGLMEEDKKQDTSEQQTEPEVSFKASTGHELSEEQKASIDFVEQLKTKFPRQEFDKILEILEKFAHDSGNIDKVLNYLSNETHI